MPPASGSQLGASLARAASLGRLSILWPGNERSSREKRDACASLGLKYTTSNIAASRCATEAPSGLQPRSFTISATGKAAYFRPSPCLVMLLNASRIMSRLVISFSRSASGSQREPTPGRTLRARNECSLLLRHSSRATVSRLLVAREVFRKQGCS